MTYLYRLASCYTRLRWNRVRFEWKPAVGTSTNGIITYGARLMDDRARNAKPKSRQEVSALYPVNDHPVWQRADMTVSRNLLMSRTWYAIAAGTDADGADRIDVAPGSLEVGLDVTSNDAEMVYGEFWIDYSVTLDGTRSEN